MSENNEFLWVEKYRPKKVSETILPKKLKDVFENIVKEQNLPNMLLTGTAGLGKTTVARAICNELQYDHIVINGSEEGNIDTLRGKIKRFASSVSLNGDIKVVILDEADYLNPQSTQPALRGFIEEFSKNCRFILTCNFKNRIIEPLHSRCGVYEFNTTKKEMQSLCSDFLKRLVFILNEEGIEFKKEVLVEMIMKHAPDWRRIINECQRFSIGGQLNTDVLLGEFNTTKKEMQSLCSDFLKRLVFILNQENIEFKKEVLVEMIMKHAPDWRRIINECQRFSIGGQLNTDVLLGEFNNNYDALFDSLKKKDFKKMRTWVTNNVDVDASSIFRSIYDRMFDKVDSSSIPQLVLILADYQYKNAFVADHELNVVACMTEIMANVEMK